jgi:uncharacterized peroxidase-related enzyme
MTTNTLTFNVPTKSEVTENNQEIFNALEGKLGFTPNLYAYFGKSKTALADYLALQNRSTSLKAKEKEVVNLVTSQINGCRYCQSAHTAIGKMNGFSEEQILDIRSGRAPFDQKLDALANFTSAVVENKGKISETEKEGFFEAGYTEESMIDVVVLIGDKIMSNYIHNLTQFPIDFPVAQEL